jgi:hypothetical protein
MPNAFPTAPPKTTGRIETGQPPDEIGFENPETLVSKQFEGKGKTG